jgi:Protein of unknown function (DUF2505)
MTQTTRQPGRLARMRFHAEHRFHGSPRAVAALLVDPDFYGALVLPDLSQPAVLDQQSEGQRTVLRLRYEFVGHVDPIARRLLGQSRLAWVQEIDLDRASDSGTLRFSSEADPKRLHGSADFVLKADGEGTCRQLKGELVVAVPVVGPRAERQIVPGLLRRLDIEATFLDEHFRG